MEFVCKLNMALHLNREIRPNVVLECSFLAQTVFERRGEEKRLGFGEIVGDLCESLHVCSRSCKKEGRKRLRL